MITINGKVYRNLQEQVEKNKEDITTFNESLEDVNERIDELEEKIDQEKTYEFTDIETVTYDTTDGAKIYGSLHTVTSDGETISETTVDLPILPGEGIIIDASETDDAIVIKTDPEEFGIVQTIGQSTSAVMSQKASTDLLNNVTVGLLVTLASAQSASTITKPAILIKNRTYRYTNNSTGSVNLYLIDTDGTSHVVSTSIVAGKTLTFTCQEDNIVSISSYFAGTGNCVLESVDEGLYDEISNLKSSVATNTTNLTKTSNTLTNILDTYSFTFTSTGVGYQRKDGVILLKNRTYTYTNDSTSAGNINLELIDNNDQVTYVTTSLAPGRTVTWTCDESDKYKAVRSYFSTAGSSVFRSADDGVFKVVDVEDRIEDLEDRVDVIEETIDPEEDYTTLSMFETIGAIGDSYTSGGIYGVPGVTEGAHYNRSWPQVLGRKSGVEFTNFSRGSLDVSHWLSDSEGLPKLEDDDAKDLYVIMLGINTEKMLSDPTTNAPVGTYADIHLDAPDTNQDTFCGHYGRMLSAIITKAPKAKIILVMPPSHTTISTIRSAIKLIGQNLNFPVIDTADDPFYSSDFYLDNLSGGHPIAATYAGMANAFEKQINKCIVNNINYFKNVG